MDFQQINPCQYDTIPDQHQLIFTANVTHMKLEINLCYRGKKVKKKKAEDKTLKAAMYCSSLYYIFSLINT
jgi:hypothetical protein